MTTMMASAVLAGQAPDRPCLGVVDDLEREDDKRGYERDESDTAGLAEQLLAELELDGFGISPMAVDRPQLPSRPPNPGRHDRDNAEPEPGLPHPQNSMRGEGFV